MVQKPSIPKGTRDFTPEQAVRRNYIFDIIRETFRHFGYAPIETPAMENLSTLLGKYGEEGDKLLFKVLNSGDCFASVDFNDFCRHSSQARSLEICEKGLRYDLTVPFARFVVQHQNELAFPFKRYQLQPVWRADRPQKGRYREFYQCDADVIGSRSLLNELELVQMIDRVFSRTDIDVIIKINNRKILAGIAEAMGCPDRLTDITVSVDKLDKTDMESVKAELLDKGIPAPAVDKLQTFLALSGSEKEKTALLRKLLSQSETGLTGVAEIEELFGLIAQVPLKQSVQLDLSLARGLNYYTGAIFEVKARNTPMGSLCGGGRYDNLTGIFGLEGMSGVGISFGADRIYDVLLSENKFPPEVMDAPKVLFFNMGQDTLGFTLNCMHGLRERGVACELYPDKTKMKKQFDYALKRGIAYVAIIGENECRNGQIGLKDLKSGEQQTLDREQLAAFFTR